MTQQDSQDNLQQRQQILSTTISNHTIAGAVVVTQNDRECWAVISYPGKPVNHILHGLLTIPTCGLWGIVWFIVYSNRVKARRIRVTVLPNLEVREEVTFLE